MLIYHHHQQANCALCQPTSPTRIPTTTRKQLNLRQKWFSCKMGEVTKSDDNGEMRVWLRSGVWGATHCRMSGRRPCTWPCCYWHYGKHAVQTTVFTSGLPHPLEIWKTMKVWHRQSIEICIFQWILVRFTQVLQKWTKCYFISSICHANLVYYFFVEHCYFKNKCQCISIFSKKWIWKLGFTVSWRRLKMV